ncbi:MAG: carboxypeptidase-like regulatory domain-containing protein [Muribaculaceae bacterium]|nr:carboxypeptidase-like regulatory domain-containing protein [Muribaculaceae bacterium]
MKINRQAPTSRLATLLLALLLMSASAWAQATRTVSGTVIDELGEPLIGVSVTLPGQPGGVTTDIDGNYRISVPAGVNRICFSYVGYNTFETDITGDKLDVQLEPSSQSLQEMVVIGYGTQKKNDLTGYVAGISE